MKPPHAGINPGDSLEKMDKTLARRSSDRQTFYFLQRDGTAQEKRKGVPPTDSSGALDALKASVGFHRLRAGRSSQLLAANQEGEKR